MPSDLIRFSPLIPDERDWWHDSQDTLNKEYHGIFEQSDIADWKLGRRRTVEAYFVTRPVKINLKRQFHELADAWRKDTAFESSTYKIVLHPAYQRIIGLGPQVIPLILEALRKRREQWFWALQALSGDNPVPAENTGNIKAMTKAWLAWGENYLRNNGVETTSLSRYR